MRLGIVAYIVPFVFVYHPALIFKGAWLDIATAVFTAAIGVILLGIGCAGYLFRPLGWAKRAWPCLAGMLLILPPIRGLSEFVPDVIGFGLGLAFVLAERAALPTPATAPEAR